MYNQRYYPMNRNGFSRNNGDRFFGGGFAVPFILGGLAGSALANNNQNYYPVYYPYPYPYPYYQYPTYNNYF